MSKTSLTSTAFKHWAKHLTDIKITQGQKPYKVILDLLVYNAYIVTTRFLNFKSKSTLEQIISKIKNNLKKYK